MVTSINKFQEKKKEIYRLKEKKYISTQCNISILSRSNSRETTKKWDHI